MGGKIAWPDWPTINAAPDTVSEWEITIGDLAACSRDEIAEDVRLSLRPLPRMSEREPHAYTDSELQRIARLVRPSPERSIEELRFHTDLFAIFIGMRVQSAPRLTPKARAEKLWKEVVLPSRSLISAVKNLEIRREITLFRLLPRVLPSEGFVELLQQLEVGTKARCDKLRKENWRGKKWDSELCMQHVYLSVLLCEFLQPDFEPARDKRFARVVDTLAMPLFPPSSSFKGAIREHADDWKEVLRKAAADPAWLRSLITEGK